MHVRSTTAEAGSSIPLLAQKRALRTLDRVSCATSRNRERPTVVADVPSVISLAVAGGVASANGEAKTSPGNGEGKGGAGRPREISSRDVRDLALAVIEGAVAAEALAKELRRSPDRRRHFAEIAERLRAVVARGSIRNALVEETAGPSASTMTLSGAHPVPLASSATPATPPAAPRAAPNLATTPPLPTRAASIVHAAPPSVASAPPTLETVEAAAIEELTSRITRLERAAVDELGQRLARLERLVTASVDRLDATMQQGLARTAAGERMVVSSPHEAIGVAQKLVDRVAARGPIVVRIE